MGGLKIGMLICKCIKETKKYVVIITTLLELVETGWDLAWPEAFRDVKQFSTFFFFFCFGNKKGLDFYLFSKLMKQDVDLIIIPSYWTLDEPGSKMIKHDPSGEHESKLINGLVTSRALESEACVVFVK